EEVDGRRLLVGAYQGILAEADPYAAYLPPEIVAERKADLTDGLTGLGVTIAFDALRNVVVVERSIPGTPAAQRGILAGDLIIGVREADAEEATEIDTLDDLADAVRLLRGDPGSEVTLTVIHGDTGEKEEVALSRGAIQIPGVRSAGMVDPARRVGYLHLPYFSESTVGRRSSAPTAPAARRSTGSWRWCCWSTATPRGRRRSSPAPWPITTGPCWWARRPWATRAS
ncbi:MAG: S41 family peptidase, partial [Planctomycetota bacterium]